MSGPEHDSDLATKFQALRRDEEERCPPFAAVLGDGRRSSRRSAPLRPILAAAAGIGLILIAVYIGLHTPRAHQESPLSLAEWKSPTDFLLATPGRDLLATPAGLRRSVLDLGKDPVPPSHPTTERRFPS
jgi:hypothetical protein